MDISCLVTQNTPLSASNGYIYEHRFVFHDKFKGKELSCVKCGADWLWRTYLDHIDHVDKDKSNNSISNLRPLCNSCNVQRTRKIKSEAKNAIPITYSGKTLTASEWAREDGVNVSGYLIRYRIKAGWSVYDSLFKRSQKDI